jgi:hypothetical protein
MDNLYKIMTGYNKDHSNATYSLIIKALDDANFDINKCKDKVKAASKILVEKSPNDTSKKLSELLDKYYSLDAVALRTTSAGAAGGKPSIFDGIKP